MEKKPVSHFAAGIILGLISVVLFLLYYFTGIAFKSGFLSFVPSLVIIGLIIYFITKYSNDTGHNSTFGALFGYGFKCTIIWVLIAVAFALLMMYIFPDYREKVLEQTRINLDKQVALTESQKDTYVKAFEDHFTLYIVGGALFLDLLMGLIASLIGAAVAKKTRLHLLTNQYNTRMDLSVIIPSLNEEESLPELCAWIERVMKANNFSYEIIVIDDGSTDNSWSVIESLHARNASIKGICFQRNYGKSAALSEGFAAAKGEVVITMDADLQDSPDEIPALREMILGQGYDLVSGWKKKRHDPIGKTIPSRFFNWVTAKVTRIPLHDFNCGLKAYKKKLVKSIEVYGEMHRYIPVIAKWSGFKKISEKVVEHHARKYGVSKFGLERFVNGFLDLASIMFVSKYGKRPMHFFGLIGTVCFLIGFVMSFYLIVSRLTHPLIGLSNRPPFYIALTAMVIGTQLFMAGFLGELMSRNAPKRNNYLIDKRAGYE